MIRKEENMTVILKSFVTIVGVLASLSCLDAQDRVIQQPTSNPSELALIDDVEEGFIELFDGTTLAGWEQKNGTAKYEVVDGTILGQTAEGSPNSFLCTEENFADFDLRFEVKVDVGLNSGVQIRSLSKPGFKKGRVHGPQVEIEIDPGQSGYIYSEGTGRGWISPEQPVKNVFINDGWNKYRVVAEGKRIRTWINGTMIEDLETPDVESLSGFIGLQVHSIRKGSGPYRVQWRNIRIRELEGTETRHYKAMRGTPEIDGKIDELWQNVPRMLTSRPVEELDILSDGESPATAEVKCLWDDQFLYCLAVVKDPKVSTTGAEHYEQDSVEFFVDGNLGRAVHYDDDDAQYRTSAAGKVSCGPTSQLENYESAFQRTDDGYIVEARIKIETGVSKKIGFDVQVNNDNGSGRRESAMKWNDSTNDTWQNASRMGVLEMIDRK
jgi:hypothetical protein